MNSAAAGAIKSENILSAESPACGHQESALVTTFFSSCRVCGEHFLLPCELQQHVRESGCAAGSLTSHAACEKRSVSLSEGSNCPPTAAVVVAPPSHCRNKKKKITKSPGVCVRCPGERFSSHREFCSHHLFHLLSVPAPHVRLVRLTPAELAAFKQHQAEHQRHTEGEVAGGGGAAGAGGGGCLKLTLRRQTNSAKNSYSAVMVCDTASCHDSDSGLDSVSGGSGVECAAVVCSDQDRLHTPEHVPAAADVVAVVDGDIVSDVHDDEGGDDEGGVIGSAGDQDMSDGSFYQLDCEDLSAEDLTETAASSHPHRSNTEEHHDKEDEEGGDDEGLGRQSEASCSPHSPGIQQETSEGEPVRHRSSTPSCSEQTGTSGDPVRPPPPRLFPVGSLTALSSTRLSSSAPPPALPSPPALSSGLVRRSTSSEPVDTKTSSSSSASLAAHRITDVDLDQLLSDVSAVVDKPGDSVSLSDNNNNNNKEGVEEDESQPLIRMAAIAANIPDERSFRQEVTAATPSLAPAPPQLLAAGVSGSSVATRCRPPVLMSASGVVSAGTATVTSMPVLVAVSGTVTVPPQTLPPAVSSLTPHAVATVPQQRLLLCFVCRAVFPCVRSLQEHLVAAHSSLQCAMCPFKASSGNELRVHCLTIHGRSALPVSGSCVPPPAAAASSPAASVRMVSLRPGAPFAVLPPNFHIPNNGPVARRGRPPLRQPTAAVPAPNMRLVSPGFLPLVGPPARGLPPGASLTLAQRRVAPAAAVSEAPPAKRRPSIPIQSDQSDCQVISVQRRQLGVPRIQSVEGNVTSSGGSMASASQPVPSTSSSAPAAAACNSQQTDVASVLANRGISVTPASSSSGGAAAATVLSVSLPSLPAGISLTPASTSSITATATTATSQASVFAVPQPPAAPSTNTSSSTSSRQAVSRPARPPTVDLTVDSPVRPASLVCRHCPRQFTSNSALQQHEMTHAFSAQQQQQQQQSSSVQSLRCRVCGAGVRSVQHLQQHVQARHPHVSLESVMSSANSQQQQQQQSAPQVPSTSSRQPDLVVPVFDLALVSREQLEQLGVRGFLPVSQINQRQGQLGLPIIGLDGLGKTGPSPRPAGFFSLGPLRYLR